ncbi:MAG: hypothetical protein WBF90_11350, partial [Rivularia sp. (in: cyanobacteria)]
QFQGSHHQKKSYQLAFLDSKLEQIYKSIFYLRSQLGLVLTLSNLKWNLNHVIKKFSTFCI